LGAQCITNRLCRFDHLQCLAGKGEGKEAMMRMEETVAGDSAEGSTKKPNHRKVSNQ